MSTPSSNGQLFRMLSEPLQTMDGFYSSKRMVSFLAFFFMLGCGIANLGWGLTIAPFIFESMQWLVITGLGLSITENVTDVMKTRIAAQTTTSTTTS